jgi:hypothetical protein
VPLNIFISPCFFDLLAGSHHFALLSLPLVALLLLVLFDDLADLLDTVDTLASTLVGLDEADGDV